MSLKFSGSFKNFSSLKVKRGSPDWWPSISWKQVANPFGTTVISRSNNHEDDDYMCMLIGSSLYKTRNFETYDLVDNLSVFVGSATTYNFIKLDDRFVGGSRGIGDNYSSDDFRMGAYYSFNGSDWEAVSINNATWFNNETGNYFLDYNPEDNFIIRYRKTEQANGSQRSILLYSIDKGESYATGLRLSSGESFPNQTRIRYFKDNMFFSPNARGNNNPRVFSYDESNDITEVNVSSPYTTGNISWEGL